MIKESQSPTEYATIRIEEVQMIRSLEGLELVVDTLMENLLRVI